jgi:hypothetical protein
MRFRQPKKSEWIVMGVVAIVIAALMFPPVVEVWDGHFRLTIAIQETEPIDWDSLSFATCWFEREANAAWANPGRYKYAFRPPDFTTDGRAVIDVSSSGRSGVWGTAGTYHHPEHLVVEFRLAETANAPLKRRRFAIPIGRGPRSITIALP